MKRIVCGFWHDQHLLLGLQDPAWRACGDPCHKMALFRVDADHDRRHVLCVICERILCASWRDYQPRESLAREIVKMKYAQSIAAVLRVIERRGQAWHLLKRAAMLLSGVKMSWLDECGERRKRQQ